MCPEPKIMINSLLGSWPPKSKNKTLSSLLLFDILEQLTSWGEGEF